jgi:hypothetical protein
VELVGEGRRLLTFALSVEGVGLALQDSVWLPAGSDGLDPFEAGMGEAAKRIARFRGVGRGRTCLLRVAGWEWLVPGESETDTFWPTGIAEPGPGVDQSVEKG